MSRRQRHQIVLLEPPEYSDGQYNTGEPSENFTTFATVRAEVEPYTGTHEDHEKQLVFFSMFRFKIRYIANVKPQFRIQFNNRYFDIIHLEVPNEIHRWIHIVAREIQ